MKLNQSETSWLQSCEFIPNQSSCLYNTEVQMLGLKKCPSLGKVSGWKL